MSVRRGVELSVRSVERNFAVLVCCGFLSVLFLISCAALMRAESVTQQASAQAGSLEQFAAEFWNWRARYQPFSTDDIPRLGHPSGVRGRGGGAIASKREQT